MRPATPDSPRASLRFAGIWSVLFGLGCGLVLGPFLEMPEALVPAAQDRNVTWWLEVEADGAVLVELDRQSVELRAIAPLPTIRIENGNPDHRAGVEVVVSNLNRDFATPPRDAEWIGPTTVRFSALVEAGQTLELSFGDARPEDPVRVFLAGDSERNFVVFDRFLADVRRERPDFVCLLGDLVQENAWYFEYYLALFEQAEVPVYTTIGNHDLVGDRRRPPFEARKEPYEEFFGPRRWAFEFRGVQFVAFDTSAPQLPAGELEWLERTLGESRAARRFVLTHKPFQDPREGEDHHLEDGIDRARLIEILDPHDGLVYCCGHIGGAYAYESHGIDVRVVGSLSFASKLVESGGEARNSYLRVTATPEAWEEEPRVVEPSGWVATTIHYVFRVFPAWLFDQPAVALGSALLLAAALGRWHPRRRLRRGPPAAPVVPVEGEPAIET